jgi:hypothetical protein
MGRTDDSSWLRHEARLNLSRQSQAYDVHGSLLRRSLRWTYCEQYCEQQFRSAIQAAIFRVIKDNRDLEEAQKDSGLDDSPSSEQDALSPGPQEEISEQEADYSQHREKRAASTDPDERISKRHRSVFSEDPEVRGSIFLLFFLY